MPEINAAASLITPDALLPRLGATDLVVIDCRFDLMQPRAGHAAWREGHIPGACYADLEHDLSAPARGAGGRHPLPDPAVLAERLGRFGVDESSEVVCYDDAGGAVAARLWWLLRWMGQRRVRVLDGGLSAWREAGYPLDNHQPAVRARRYAGVAGKMPVIDADAVIAGLADDSLLLLDAREPARFTGKREPIDARAGHVPKAVNFPLQANLEAGRFRDPADIRAGFEKVIGDRDLHEVACMCGSGVTACHLLLALDIAGLPGASLYTGSWSDWISDSRRPVATGP